MNYTGHKEDWNKSGIYLISNSLDERVYIGSSKSLRDRFRHHRRQLIKGNNPSLLLQRFASKYGVETLTFSVLELVDEEFLLEREEFYITSMKPALNAMMTAQRVKGYKHKEETKTKMREIAKKSFKNGRKSWNKGKKLTDEEKTSFKECSKGISRLANRVSVCLYEFDGLTLKECFESATDAVNKTGICMSSIFSNISGKYKKTKLGIWKLKN